MEKSIEQIKKEKKAEDIGVFIKDPYLFTKHIIDYNGWKFLTYLYGGILLFICIISAF